MRKKNNTKELLMDFIDEEWKNKKKKTVWIVSLAHHFVV